MKGIGAWLFLVSSILLVILPAHGAPRDVEFAGQVIVGTAGGALLGMVGSWVGSGVCRATAGEGEDVATLCRMPGIYGYLLGVPVGATLGVGIAGASFGMEGDLFLTAAGAVVGEALGIGILAVLQGTVGEGSVSFAAAYGLVPFLSAALATMGYGLGSNAAWGYNAEMEGIFLAFGMERVSLPVP